MVGAGVRLHERHVRMPWAATRSILRDTLSKRGRRHHRRHLRAITVFSECYSMRRKRMRQAPLHLLAIALLVFLSGAREPCMAIERAQYAVVTSQPPFEIRDYDASVVAIVTVDGSRNDAVNAGFRVLAGYIFGNNRQKTKIAMTAPVTQLPRSAVPGTATSKIPTSAGWVVRFMMPAGYTLKSLPAPTDDRVHFERSPAHRAAAIRFSGFWSDANLQAHERELLQWTMSRHLAPQAAPVYAYYDPPWTPWFMRRIEVLVDVAPG